MAAAVPGSDTRIQAIRWLSVVERADSATVARLGAAIVAAARGDPGALARSAEEWVERNVAAGSLLSAVVAEELDATGFPVHATAVRVGLVTRWPQSPEAPGALLTLARRAAPTNPTQALDWLERLIVEHPRSALAPVARRELATLQGLVPST